MSESSEANLLKRPEAVIFVVFAVLFAFWNTYLSLLDEVGSTSLSSRQLAQRLSIPQRVLRRRKRQPGFAEWTRRLDPDGIAWAYQTGGLYVPVLGN